MPAILSVPIELPGLTLPLFSTLPVIVPEPANTPLTPIVTALVREPFTASVPAAIAVPPVALFVPVSVSRPIPSFVKEPAPFMLPANVVSFAVPAVSALPPSVIVLPLTPVRSLIVTPDVAPEISKPAPLIARFSPLDAAIEPFADKANMPALTVVPPV